MNIDIQNTADGSKTLFVPQLNEHYHSVKGAFTESMHIFISCGLFECKATEPRVLEVGFGTGLNALLTLIEAIKGRMVYYTSVERFPLTIDIVRELGVPSQIDSVFADYHFLLHKAPWNEWCEIHNNFLLRKVEADFTSLNLNDKYDVIYFDAFAPEKQPEMWTQDIFDKLFSCLDNNGILVTYCAKGAVRRMLQASGFVVERLAGPPGGKREILRARKFVE